MSPHDIDQRVQSILNYIEKAVLTGPAGGDGKPRFGSEEHHEVKRLILRLIDDVHAG